jgi:hypothetical protein
VPETVGLAVALGAPGEEDTAVGDETAAEEPAGFEAVTTTLTASSTSELSRR